MRAPAPPRSSELSRRSCRGSRPTIRACSSTAAASAALPGCTICTPENPLPHALQPTWARSLGARSPVGTKFEGDERGGGDAGRYDEQRGAEAVGGRDSQRLAGEAARSEVGNENENGQPDGGADRRARGGEARGNPLLSGGDSRPRGDEHRREGNPVADAERDQTWDERRIGSVHGHRETERRRAEPTDNERADEGGPETEPCRQWTGHRRAGDHDRRREQEADTGFQSVVAANVLEIEGEEVQ